MKRKANKFEVVGSITVDAGLVQIGDPCYGYERHEDWLAFLDDNGILERDSELDKEGAQGIPHAKEGGNYDDCSKAVLVQSGSGDGVYDVLVKKCPETGRIKELKIKFF